MSQLLDKLPSWLVSMKILSFADRLAARDQTTTLVI